MTTSSLRHATLLETVSVTVSEPAVEFYENALGRVCTTIGIFEANQEGTLWRVEGVKNCGYQDDELTTALLLAAIASGEHAPLERTITEANGWLARTYETFPEQKIGRRFIIRGTHLPPIADPTHIVLTLDAGVAFGSGEHGSTRGCLRALEYVAYRRPCRILDIGCGTGILAMASAALLHKPILAVDIDPWSVLTTQQNTRRNKLHRHISCHLGNGWHTPALRHKAPFDLVFANILARPLCLMAKNLAYALADNGTAILSGLLQTQVPMVLSAHRKHGLVLERLLKEGEWATLIIRKFNRTPKTSH
ncbi:MAG: 50S ribosomal protein L11 methyltransferase [Acetobacter sp.]|nr:50S ribosomal protein L11 methyltransferase [Acetobacter sp.]